MNSSVTFFQHKNKLTNPFVEFNLTKPQTFSEVVFYISVHKAYLIKILICFLLHF